MDLVKSTDRLENPPTPPAVRVNETLGLEELMKMDLVKSSSRLKTPTTPACGSIEDPGLEDMNSGLVVKSIMERTKCDLAKVCDSSVNLADSGNWV